MTSKKEEILKILKFYCERDGFTLVSEYKTAKTKLQFIHNETKIKHYQTWDTIRTSFKITIKYNKTYYTYKTKKKLLDLNFKPITSGLYSDKRIIEYKCKSCNYVHKTTCNKVNVKLTHCTKCNNKSYFNKGINLTNVKKNPMLEYYLYLGSFINNDNQRVFKIGLYKESETQKRFKYEGFNYPIVLLTIPVFLYKGFYIEQTIIKEYEQYKYKGIKFGGYTESFNNFFPYKKVIIRIMSLLEEIQDRKFCELLESLEVGNQQPS